jgi:hypothetical protein
MVRTVHMQPRELLDRHPVDGIWLGFLLVGRVFGNLKLWYPFVGDRTDVRGKWFVSSNRIPNPVFKAQVASSPANHLLHPTYASLSKR